MKITLFFRSPRAQLAYAALALSTQAHAFGGHAPMPAPTSTPDPGEPAYCVYSNFSKHEVPESRPGIQRAHAYRFGPLTIVGLAVGNSKPAATEAMATELSTATAQQNYCTWYFNNGDEEAVRYFNHFYVPKPVGDPAPVAQAYRTTLAGIFAGNSTSLLSCARDQHYVAMGCDGMMHRGPTVFGMTLAFSGCTPAHAAEIVTYVWGLNGVNPAARLAAIQEGYALGQQNPQASAELRQLLSAD
jgi:hypothetical protein